jgi:N-succinyl-L-ornithine transcarbamylase
MKQFISVHDAGNIDQLVQLALHYKANPLQDRQAGHGKRLGCLFLNPSLRTRLSTQVAAQQLGMDVIVLNAAADGWKLEFTDGAIMNGQTVEHIKDAAPILGQYVDILAIRSFPEFKDREADYEEQIIGQFIRYAGVPVISLESATLHPLQSLADIITITEALQAYPERYQHRKPRIVLSWAPHIKALPQCVANSFAQWVNQWQQGELVITHPPGWELSEAYTQGAIIETDQQKALEGADFVYVKNWSSYQDYGKIKQDAADWMLTLQKLSVTRAAKIMHCLPVRRNVELSDEVLDSPQSLVQQQGGNRVWAAQAVLKSILHGGT